MDSLRGIGQKHDLNKTYLVTGYTGKKKGAKKTTGIVV